MSHTDLIEELEAALVMLTSIERRIKERAEARPTKHAWEAVIATTTAADHVFSASRHLMYDDPDYVDPETGMLKANVALVARIAAASRVDQGGDSAGECGEGTPP